MQGKNRLKRFLKIMVQLIIGILMNEKVKEKQQQINLCINE